MARCMHDTHHSAGKTRPLTIEEVGEVLPVPVLAVPMLVVLLLLGRVGIRLGWTPHVRRYPLVVPRLIASRNIRIRLCPVVLLLGEVPFTIVVVHVAALLREKLLQPGRETSRMYGSPIHRHGCLGASATRDLMRINYQHLVMDLYCFECNRL